MARKIKKPIFLFGSEDEAVFEPALADQVHRLLEIICGFAAESHDEIT